jgi:alkylation response protein AidB-like acyl-CoA dehydrogenase
MSHYKSNLRDIEFMLFDVLGVGDKLGTAPFADVDAETARGMLDEVRRLAEGPIAASFVAGDRNPPVFDPATHSVTLNEEFKKSFKAQMDAQWWRLEVPAELGGTVVPRTLTWAVGEMLLGANPALHMYSGGPAFAGVLYNLGTPDQKKMAQRMIDGLWGATMVLTEPDAGSDVGAGRTKAVQQADGSWHIEGVKRFITSAEHDLTDNIVHLVLARPEGGAPGTKGLSLFVVPKFLFDIETGELGARNGAYVTNVEKKMGIKASTTCEITFGDKEPAIGWLVGDVHDGIAQMFKVIEYARMMVGTKAIAALSTGYRNAEEYAKTRIQSADLTQMTDKAAPRVSIIHHPDVRRMLMLQKSYSEGLRALVLYTASFQDKVQIADAAGEHDDLAERINDLLLPVVKAVGSERSYEMLALSLQTFGGSGFLQDYPIEQYIRDAKIDSVYEGTTGIQGQDFFFRKIVRDKAVALTAVATEISEFLETINGEGRLKEESTAVASALEEIQTMIGVMVGQLTSAQEDPRNIYLVGQNTTRLLMSVGDLAIGWLLLRQASVALTKLDANGVSEADHAYFEGKVAAARFFAATVLPELRGRRKVMENTDNALMDVSEAAF